MNIQQLKQQFEKALPKLYERTVLQFNGVDGYDVYNCSAPFFTDGYKCLYGRVEKHDVWSDSRVILFREIEPDKFEAVPESTLYPLEDPFILHHNDEWLLGGVHVVKNMGELKSYSCYFFRSTDAVNQEYYTTGPLKMKDIRMVSMGNKIAVFTRPENKVGFTVVDDVEHMTADVLENAPIINLIDDCGHGGVNQAIMLDSGLIAIIGHNSYSYAQDSNADWYSQNHVYFVTAAVFNPDTKQILMNKIIATRACFVPDTPAKILPTGIPMADVVFPSGVLMRNDGRLDLYAGVSDSGMQRIVIDNPFSEYGNFIDD